MGGAGLAEMHLGVDHARQNMETRDADCLARAGAGEIAGLRDFAARDPDVPRAHAGMIGHRAALQYRVEVLGHVEFLTKSWLAPCHGLTIYEEAGLKSRCE